MRKGSLRLSPSLFSRLRPEMFRLAAGAFCLLLTNFLAFTIPAVLQGAIDALAVKAADALDTIATAGLAILALAILAAAARIASRVLIFDSGRNIELRLRRDLFSSLVRQPPSFYQRHPTGDLMSRLTNDLSAVRMLFGPGILNLINTLIVYATGLYLMSRLSGRLTWLALIPLPLVIAVGRLSSRTIHGASRALADELGRLSTAIQEDLAGLAVVRSYALEDVRKKQFAARNNEYFRRSLVLVRARGLLGPVFAIVGGLGTLIVLWAGGKEVIAGRLSVGGLVAFNAYLVYLSWPTIAFGWVLALWQRGIAGWGRVRELLWDVNQVEATGETIGDAQPRNATVEVRHLTLNRDGQKVVDDVSFRIPAGKTLALVGRTGSGKSTVADALLRFVDVPPGSVFVGEADITAMSPQTLRGFVGYAPQEPFLFSARIDENIAFGRRDFVEGDAEVVRQAATASGLERDLAIFPDGIATMVGERGVTLSGGQRQRVALARALAAEPKVLILDDSLSSVDTETEKTIMSHLRPFLAQRTAIVISHRPSAIKEADEILVLEEGRVVARGTHDQLLQTDGPYADLYREERTGDPKGAR